MAADGTDAPRDDATDLTRLSKLLAFLLRHRPEAIGLELDPDGGWVAVDVLVRQINAHRRLPYALTTAHLAELVEGEGQGRFELDGERIRARGGHSVRGVRMGVGGPPEFLFCTLAPDPLAARQGEGSLDLRGVLLRDDEEGLGEEDLVVVEAGRASRQGVAFEADPEGFRAEEVPARFVPTLRPGYLRQISAGGVLVRGERDAAEFALIRTLPRDQTQGDAAAPAPEPAPEEPPDIADARADADRRAGADRRKRDQAPPEGVERRRGASRRLRRRRRSARWAAQGRLELPKGKLEPGETVEQAAVREAREEMGVEGPLELRGLLSKNHYCFRTRDGLCIFKTVHYFLLVAPVDPKFTPRREEGIVSVEWWPGRRAIEQVAFPNLRPVLEQAWERVTAEP